MRNESPVAALLELPQETDGGLCAPEKNPKFLAAATALVLIAVSVIDGRFHRVILLFGFGVCLGYLMIQPSL